MTDPSNVWKMIYASAAQLAPSILLLAQPNLQCSVMKFALGLHFHHFDLPVGMCDLHHASVDIQGPNTILTPHCCGRDVCVGREGEKDCVRGVAELKDGYAWF